jgi:hypothetical protein
MANSLLSLPWHILREIVMKEIYQQMRQHPLGIA